MQDEPGDLARLRAEVAQLSDRVSALERSIQRAAGSLPASPPRTNFGVTAINRIGATTLAIGIIFFFKYAVDEHLIAAAAGVILGLLLGIALLLAGDWLNRHGQRVFAQGIGGCGLAALYIASYASFAFYDLISRAAGFAGLMLVCALAVGLSLRFQSAAIAALAFVGALMTPWLLHSSTSELWLEWVYLLLVNLTSIAIGVRQRWPVVAITGPLTLLVAYFLFRHAPGSFIALAAVLAAAHLLCAFYAATQTGVRNSLYVVGHVCLLAAGMRLVSLELLRESAAYQMDSLLLAIWGIALLAVGISRNSRTNRLFGLVLLALVVAKLYLWDVWSMERAYRISAFLALGVLLLLASWVYSRTSASNKL